MNHYAVAELSADLILRYYENDHMPFLQHMDDEALWYGPALGQFIKGREAMIKAWGKEEHALSFTVGDMRTRYNAAHPSSCNVMLTYAVITHYPDGHDISVDQRLLLCWGDRTVHDVHGERRKEPRILVCHISNPHGKHDDDVIYPKHFHQIYNGQHAMPQKSERIHFHGTDRSDYFFYSDSIYYFEAAFGGKHSILHTVSDSYEVLGSVDSYDKRFSKFFLRCHRSYLVNPHYIRSIRRFKVSLTNGVVLPVPEKKYTAFRDRALQFFNS